MAVAVKTLHIIACKLRWVSLNYNISGVSLSCDNTKLLVVMANKVQEVELMEKETDSGERDKFLRRRQLFLPHTQLLDPVVMLR